MTAIYNIEIQNRLDKLRNLTFQDPGQLRAIEFHQIISAEMELMTALLDRQHDDLQKLSTSSSRLEKLTGVIIAFTGSLIILSINELFHFIPALPK